MSRSKASRQSLFRLPIAEFQYREMEPKPVALPAEEEPVPVKEVKEPEVQMTEAAFAERLAEARSAGYREAETSLRGDSQQRSERETGRISKAIAHFEQSRRDYFARVEAEVVQLALTIAGKILHRESQVDPMLVAALVQIALGQLKEGAAATLRVLPSEAARWRAHFAETATGAAVALVEDGELQAGDCVLETEMGTVNFSLAVQLKEVERGFLDVLAQTPKA